MRIFRENADPDWPKKAWAVKWMAGFRCQICSRRFDRNGEAHHNTYDRKGHEDSKDLIALCDLCHALFHWAEKNRADLLAHIEQQKQETGETSTRLEWIDEFMRGRTKELSATLAAITEELDGMEAGFRAEQEYRRAA